MPVNVDYTFPQITTNRGRWWDSTLVMVTTSPTESLVCLKYLLVISGDGWGAHRYHPHRAPACTTRRRHRSLRSHTLLKMTSPSGLKRLIQKWPTSVQTAPASTRPACHAGSGSWITYSLARQLNRVQSSCMTNSISSCITVHAWLIISYHVSQ